MKTKKTDDEKKPNEADFLFPCGDFQKMAKIMKNCCREEGGAVDCCSMMKRMMERGKGKESKTQETQQPPKGGENG